MAANVTIYNFIAWLREQIEPDRLSALITGYNYTDDSDETIMEALQSYPEFKKDLGRLLGQSVKENETELNRSVGGVRFESTSLSLKDWQKIMKQNDFDRAIGDSSGSGTAPKKDYKALINGVLGNALDFFFGPSPNQNQNAGAAADDNKKDSGSSTAMWIITGVVIVAIIAILFLALSKK